MGNTGLCVKRDQTKEDEKFKKEDIHMKDKRNSITINSKNNLPPKSNNLNQSQ